MLMTMKTARSIRSPREVHIQLCAPDEITALQGSEGLSAWLAPSEREMLVQFYSAKRRRDWLAGRLAAKRAMADYLAQEHQLCLPPSQITIGYDGQGRPHPKLLPSDERPFSRVEQALEEISLSLAHSDGWGLAAVAHQPSAGWLGVDLQKIRPVRSDLAERILSANERRELRERFSHGKAEGFFIYWTLKEAALKALGLRLPMRAVHVDLTPQGGSANLRIGLSGDPLIAEGHYWKEPEGLQAAAVL